VLELGLRNLLKCFYSRVLQEMLRVSEFQNEETIKPDNKGI